MPELELIKLARHISTFWSLLAFTILIVALLAGRIVTRSQNDPHDQDEDEEPPAFRLAVLTRVLLFGAVIVGAGLVVKVLPLFAFQDTPIHGVVLRKAAQTTVNAAQVSVDGLSELGTTSDGNGNFQIRVPANRRQDNYTVRAQLGGEGGISEITDAAAPRKSVKIELPPPADYDWITINIPEGWSLRAVLQRLADGDKATISYSRGCTEAFLNSKVHAGELRARSTADVMEELPRKLSHTSNIQIKAIRDKDWGRYEIDCQK